MKKYTSYLRTAADCDFNGITLWIVYALHAGRVPLIKGLLPERRRPQPPCGLPGFHQWQMEDHATNQDHGRVSARAPSKPCPFKLMHRAAAIQAFLRPLLCIVIALAIHLTPLRAAELRAGAAAANITPTIGTVMNGGLLPAVATGVHDELQVRALVLDDGSTQLAWVVVDACLIDREFFDDVKRLLRERCGLPPERVMISTTHSHSAGSVTGVHRTEADPAYRAWLPSRLVDAVVRAQANLAPARLGWGRADLPAYVHNRRLLVRPGVGYTNQLGEPNPRAKMNWDSPNPADGDPSGPVDPEIFALSVRHTDGRPLAVLANYSLHYADGAGGGLLSADYFGVFADELRRRLGADHQSPPFIGIMANGTSGDVNRGKEPAPVGSAPDYWMNRVGRHVAEVVAKSVQDVPHRADVKLAGEFAEVRLKTRRPSPAEVERARDLIHGRADDQLRTWPEVYAREQLILAGKPDEVSVPVQVFRIGDVAVAAWPGEIFAVSGLELKRRSPVKPLFNVSLANGWFGYIPPPEQFGVGAYETWRARTSWMETNATVKLTDALLELLQKVR